MLSPSAIVLSFRSVIPPSPVGLSDGNVLGGRTVGDEMYTLTVTPDGEIEGEVPGGYQYNFVAGE